MKIKIKTRNGDEFFHEITTPPCEVGGEGEIYPINSSRYGECFLKIYLKSEKALSNKRKIEFLFTHKAPFEHENIKYCWPIGIASKEDGTFCGFMMECAIKDSQCLTILSNYNIGDDLSSIGGDWNRLYNLGTKSGLRNRLRLLSNLARAISGLHKTDNYCLVDLKPENIFITSDAKISIIDIDSMQVKTPNLFYKAAAFTPNYFPAEAYTSWKNEIPQKKDCDIFAFACCAYMILTGTHPYTNVILQEPYQIDDCNLISSRIKEGLYLRGAKSKYIKRVNPIYDLHYRFDLLPKCVQNLFNETFNNIKRPSIEDWRIGLRCGFKDIDIR